MNRLSLVLLLNSSSGAAGFAARCRSSGRTPPSHLRDSLLHELFEGDDRVDGGGGGAVDEGVEEEEEASRREEVVLPPKNCNDDVPPFSSAESARDRARRMEMARELQKAFYKEPDASSSSSSSSSDLMIPTPATNANEASASLFDLPTLTTRDGIKGADESALLPGYQFVWDVHHPRHSHMFHKILAGPAPWHFAHVSLPEKPPRAGGGDGADGGKAPVADSFRSYHDLRRELNSASPVYGTLLRITDRRFRDEDGRIVLAVQAIDRIRVRDAASSPGGAYLRANAQVAPDEESIRTHYPRALLTSASYLAGRGDDDAMGDDDSDEEDLSSVVRGAARAAAAADARRLRRFEYLPVFLQEKPRRPSDAASIRSKPGDSRATKVVQDAVREQEREREEANGGGPEYAEVVRICGYDAFAYSSLGDAEAAASKALEAHWETLAEERKARRRSAEEEDPFGARDSPPSILPELPPSCDGPPASVESATTMEYRVWTALDEMIRLLSAAASATVPVPSQLLGLLPQRSDWPREFVLENYAKSMATSGSSIGSAFHGPFVRVDRIASVDPSAYSPLRRAQRLSYTIWLLLDGLKGTGAEPGLPSHEEILATESVERRLGAAKEALEGINAVLKKMIPEKRKDDEEKK
ncbi:hypothetical protein ACHAWF_011194 [Thalassiosira exigua]